MAAGEPLSANNAKAARLLIYRIVQQPCQWMEPPWQDPARSSPAGTIPRIESEKPGLGDGRDIGCILQIEDNRPRPVPRGNSPQMLQKLIRAQLCISRC